MNLDLANNRDYLSVALRTDSPLSHVAFGLETGAVMFMSRGVFALEFTREQDKDKVNFTTRPLVRQKEMLWSNCVRLSDLAKAGEFPRGLFAKWEPIKGETLIEMTMLQDQTIGELAWGVSDVVVDLFKRGATKVRLQYSQKVSQILFNALLSEEAMKQLVDHGITCYEDSDTIDCLPWP